VGKGDVLSYVADIFICSPVLLFSAVVDAFKANAG
jgi:hypothetical protein